MWEFLKGTEKEEANEYIDIPVSTGIGIGRNVTLSYNCDVAIAISGKYGTLSEIAFAFQLGKPVVGYNTWDLKGIHKVNMPTDVINKVIELLNGQ